MSLTFICLAIAIHGDALRCANNPGGNALVQLAQVEASELPVEALAVPVPLKLLVPGKVACQQADADPRAAGFQKLNIAGRIAARCSAQGQDIATLLIAERGPVLRDKPRTRGLWARRVEMTKTWLLAAN